MDSRQARIKLLSRVNRENAATPVLLEELSKALGTNVDRKALVDPLEADELMAAFQSGYAGVRERNEPSYRRFFQANEQALVFSLANCLAGRLTAERVFFLTKLARAQRAVELRASELFTQASSAINFDGDSLSALSEDRSQGVLIDHNPDDSKQAYEIAVWGDRWPMVVLACDQTSVCL